MARELVLSLTRKDFVVETYKSGGAGGQHRDKTDTCVRIRHPASGAVGQACESRSQTTNKKNAFLRLAGSEKFKAWLRVETGRSVLRRDEIEREIQCAVQQMMAPKNLLIEIGENGEWVPEA